jgi:hypothetical protein
MGCQEYLRASTRAPVGPAWPVSRQPGSWNGLKNLRRWPPNSCSATKPPNRVDETGDTLLRGFERAETRMKVHVQRGNI